MLSTAIQIAVAPLLVGLATLAGRRFGEELGGLLSAFPAIVGPVLLIATQQHGRDFAARAATGTLIGLVALSAFCVVYGRLLSRGDWRAALAAAWAITAVVAAPLSRVAVSPTVALGLALTSFAVAHRLLRRPGAAAGPVVPEPLLVRMGLTLVLVAGLAAVAGVVGPVVAGILTSLPVLASVLAVSTQRTAGAEATRRLLRGMLGGLAGFAAFCWLVAVLLEPLGTAAAFAIATAGALVAQGVAAGGLSLDPVVCPIGRAVRGRSDTRSS